jgi:hypothetical protein
VKIFQAINEIISNALKSKEQKEIWPIILIAIVISLLGSVATHADAYDDAAEAHKQGDYLTAYKLWKPLAETGNESAQNNLGILYRDGEGITQNYVEAIKWFQRSADQGSAWGEYNLGMAYELGTGVPANQQEALKWYSLSANQGDSAAQTAIGFMYRDGNGVNKDEAEAIKWFKLAAAQNNSTARAALAILSHDLNKLAFVMPSYWILARSMAVADQKLMFRRYSVIIERENLSDIDAGKNQQVTILSEGSLINSMIFNCERDRQKTDFLTIHLPDYLDPQSFDHRQWVSRLDIRNLADERSGSVEGEYIKGDIFIDANKYQSTKDFLNLISASRLSVEFGDKNDRVILAASDQIGSANMRGFIREYLPHIPNFASGLQFLDTADMIQACLRYKRTGRY